MNSGCYIPREYIARNRLNGAWMASNSTVRGLIRHVKAKAPAGKCVDYFGVDEWGGEFKVGGIIIPHARNAS
jgi:hypothetical protein